ncbi:MULTISPECIES: hypothetical protein [Leeia]|uniref:Uncharacterized protein n=1 Tax=Leeia aquatica TaxID=2725557 RepID=A0A847S530_9NEIS|nr:hypothetical protein [Leeia aquatica]NLR74893.1 hypothetical protein [Leeia aquatica]
MLMSLLMSGVVLASGYNVDPKPLPQTLLYTRLAKGCEEVSLQGWKHPVKGVFEHNRVKLYRVQLCNERKYPVFYVDVPYDPQGQTGDYFWPLYESLRKANGGWPLSLVAVNNNTVIMLTWRKDGVALPEFEFYKPDPA